MGHTLDPERDADWDTCGREYLESTEPGETAEEVIASLVEQRRDGAEYASEKYFEEYASVLRDIVPDQLKKYREKNADEDEE